MFTYLVSFGLLLNAVSLFLPEGTALYAALDGLSWVAVIGGVIIQACRRRYVRRLARTPVKSKTTVRKWLNAGLLVIVAVQIIVSVGPKGHSGLSRLITAVSASAFVILDVLIVTLDRKAERDATAAAVTDGEVTH